MSSLKHYGMPRRSGRYPWGSGDNPEQRGRSFLGTVNELRKQGQSDLDIAKGMGINSSQFRERVTISKADIRAKEHTEALRYKDKGYSNTEIGRRMGINESSVRSLLDPTLHERSEKTRVAANMLKDAVKQYKYVDVGYGMENHMGISRTKLKAAIEMLRDDGYQIHNLQVPQAGTDKKTSLLALVAPLKEGQTAKESWKETYDNMDKIRMVTKQYTNDGELNDYKLAPVKSMDSKKILVKFKEDGGSLKDGVIDIRRGVEDLNLGNSNYAQVRIGVDGTHYMKGMAIYNDDIPDGYDAVYNTNKPAGTPLKGKSSNTVFKNMEKNDAGEIDADNPFGARLEAQKGFLNIIHEEGKWEEWNRSLSSQMLSKQPKALIKQQLDLSLAIKQEDFEDIKSLTNPAVKKTLLQSFADDVDAAAVHLDAAALPRQGTHIILPFPKMKEGEIYAPNYNNGELVVLIRHPHGGTFEIPQLRVNNKYPDIKKIIGANAKDAVGIHPKVAQQLSGADFDGDTVLVIPTTGKTIKTSSPIKELIDFDPVESYKGYPGIPKMSDATKGLKMGDISNLITDMTLRKADESEIVRAVKHSMVVIDAQKKDLNYKQSFIDHGIGALKKKYQGKTNAGASTLISKARSQQRMPERKEYVKVDPETGKKIYTLTGATYVSKKTGKVIEKTFKSTKMAEEEDAFNLSSGTIAENLYAAYANKLKAMANSARKEAYHTPGIVYSPSANRAYKQEVDSLKAQLNIAQRNAPVERQAQIYANKVFSQKLSENKNMTFKEQQKVKGQAIQGARLRFQAKKQKIDITPRQWDAIQAGAVSNNTLLSILRNSDPDTVRKYATPRTTVKLSPAKLNKARAMQKAGHTQADIASALGVSASLVSKSLD